MIQLKLLPYKTYRGVNRQDPLRYYYWPVVGSLYRRRVELALSECKGGEKILEIGFGTGLSFLNLAEMYREIHGLDLTANIPEVASVFEPLGVHPVLQNGNVLAMPYPDHSFDTVLLISILEHLQPADLIKAFHEIYRVLKPGGQVVYGVPVEKPLMVVAFRLLGVDIREHHYSTEEDVRCAAQAVFEEFRIIPVMTILGQVYEVGHFSKR